METTLLIGLPVTKLLCLFIQTLCINSIIYTSSSTVGSFDPLQSANGRIAWFNIWDVAYTEDQLQALQPDDFGNVLNMTSFEQNGFPITTFIDCKELDFCSCKSM